MKWHEGRGVTDPEDRDEHAAANIFRVPKVARWGKLQASAKQPTIGNLVDDAVVAIEKENPKLKGVLPKDYARPTLNKHRLGELIDSISKIGLGDDVSRSKDILGRVYEYFPGRFAAAEGKGDCAFYTPQCVVKLLVRMINRTNAAFLTRVVGLVACSSRVSVRCGTRRQAGRYHNLRTGIRIHTTWRLAMTNLAIRGMDVDLGGSTLTAS